MKEILIAILLGVLPLTAEEIFKKTLLEQMIQPRLSVESSYLGEANLYGYNGGVAVTKNKVSFNNEMVGLSYTNWVFNWNHIDALPFGDGINSPIEQMHSIRLNANLPYRINEKWFLLTSLSATSTFEDERDDSYGAALFSFASYKLSDDHTFEMGAFVNYHPTATLALPALSYSYRARHTDGFQVMIGFPRSYIGYNLNKDMLLRFGMIFSQSLIRLSDHSKIESGGYVESKDYMSNVGFTYALSRELKFETDLLYSIKRDIIFYNKNADELKSYEIEPSFGLNVKLGYLF